MVGPIVPEHARRQLPKEPSVSFDYAAPALGPFKLTMARDSERLIVTIVSGQAAPEPSTAPPVVPRRSQQRRSASRLTFRPRRRWRRWPPGPPIDRLFRLMAAAGASDLHLTVGMPPLIRKDGRIQPLETGAAAARRRRAIEALLQPIIPDKNASEFAARHDTDFAYEIAGLARFRANIFIDRKGAGAVFRVIPTKILTAEQLGLSPHILQLCRLTKGLVLVTGPTGSGKSTTLCAMVDYINRTRDDHIITIEDPIEFVHENKKCLHQPARGRHAHRLVQGRAARGAARRSGHRPGRRDARSRDGGDRDRDGRDGPPRVRHAAHHAPRPRPSTAIIDQFPSDRQSQIRVMLSESLRGVIAQTLCRKIGGGRVAALEVLIVTPPRSAT